VAEKARLLALKKAGAAKYNSMNKTVGRVGYHFSPRYYFPLAFDESRRPILGLRSPWLCRVQICHASSARFMGQCL
jgi:hypothetical protein